MPAETKPASFQTTFHRRWHRLHDPDVRTLAWLLDAPDLLDGAAPPWQGKVAKLGGVDASTADWLHELDACPEPLHAYLAVRPFTRLGRYAEKLMAFYLRHAGVLVEHGLQVRSEKGGTLGEFDFLVRIDGRLLHWEFATKLYLLEDNTFGRHADYFVGPGLADTLGLKIRKIMEKQLALSRHPAAAASLPEPVTDAQALVKGWLFYHDVLPHTETPPGISAEHCRGFWCALSQIDYLPQYRFLILPRLAWLAPARAQFGETMDLEALQQQLQMHFQQGSGPALVAVLSTAGEEWLEVDRGFIVPDDWQRRAAECVSATK
jgi:hypothetical protein